MMRCGSGGERRREKYKCDKLNTLQHRFAMIQHTATNCNIHVRHLECEQEEEHLQHIKWGQKEPRERVSKRREFYLLKRGKGVCGGREFVD